MKNILVVDDSALMRRVESDIINSDKRFHVLDTATNGLEAFDFAVKNSGKYDAVILDINMPKMNGIEFLEALEKQKIKMKVIVVSTAAVEGASVTIRALELGAFDYVSKPDSFIDVTGDSFRKHLLLSLEYATGVEKTAVPMEHDTPKRSIQPNIRSVTGSEKAGAVSPMNPRAILAEGMKPRRPHKNITGNAKRLVVIASSTGGPKALQVVISMLPKNLNAPVLVVQHMSEGFTKSLAERLNEQSEITVVEAQGGERLEKGKVYVAKGGSQMRLNKKAGDYILDINVTEPARNGLRPCADILFESIAELDYDDISCVVLTGMGGDGTMGIRRLNDSNNTYVIAQDEQTSTVYGMPKVVYEAGLTDVVRPLNEIADEIMKNTGVQ